MSKLSLARANQDRDYCIFEEYAYFLVSGARQKRKTGIFKLGGNVYIYGITSDTIIKQVMVLSFMWVRYYPAG
ncbi:hypothetical protein [Parabacteroides sp. Marseille-P3160]|uniref:hypothetical protein n=1 Tax=Parabacteroides sp. Marseille-P3160 TaxID=1917887 RepID=UPI001117B575|nr:hypothetical protein [Parabacteroides sp. Marseille-P3160]